MISLTIDNQQVQVQECETILQAAREAGTAIPTLCFNDNFPARGSCGICVVETADGRLVRACATPAIGGMKIITHSKRVISARKHLLELLLSTHIGDCKSPCQLACPAQTDCQGYIALIAGGQLHEAARRMIEAHPFPASVARVCPRPCEAECRRRQYDEPVNIAGLKRFATDMVMNAHMLGKGSDSSAYSDLNPKLMPGTGQSVAIIGGGPAGLTAAFFLRRAGHEVMVYDYMPKMGGLLRYGIPEYRLPKAILDAEISLLAKIGITFRNKTRLVSDTITKQNSLAQNPAGSLQYVSLPRLQEQFGAVIIAIGAEAARPMGIPGEDLPHVISGIDFLRKVAESQSTCELTDGKTAVPLTESDIAHAVNGKKVAVIGGSNTAIDAARTAIRMNATATTIVYRRTKEEMTADQTEIAEAEEEGTNFKFLSSPAEITANGIRLQKMTLGEPGTDGRQIPIPILNQEELLEADIVITAIGQSVAPDGLELLEKSQSAITANPHTFQTGQPGIFAIGDATGQSAYAIEAIGQGRKAAAIVHAFLSGKAPSPYKHAEADCLCQSGTVALPWETLPDILIKNENPLTGTARIPRENPIKKEAPKGFEEIHKGLTAAQAIKEAGRCLSCGCEGYGECKLILLANQYKAGSAFAIPLTQCNKAVPPHSAHNTNKCILCGLCIQACAMDRAILTMAHRGLKTQVEARPSAGCAKCGNCAAVCPTGARNRAFPLEKS